MFSGKKFVVTGNRIANKRKEILKRIIKKHGGTVTEDIKECDLIVSTEPVPLKTVVEPDYISKCVEENRLLPAEAFLLVLTKNEPVELENESSDASSEDEKQTEKTKNYACFKKCILNGPNEDIVKQLSVIRNHRYVTGNARSELSYSKAISGLRSLPHRVHAGEKVPGMGPKITAYVSSYLETGRMPEVDELEAGEEYPALDRFCQIYGVGPKHAREYFQKGYRTAEDIPMVELTTFQQIGIKYYQDFMKPLSRSECQGILRVIEQVIESSGLTLCKVEATGGYRRGKDWSNDLDVFISNPRIDPQELCETVMRSLTKAGYIQNILVQTVNSAKSRRKHHSSYEDEDVERCFVVWKGPERMHRVDLLFPTPEQYPFAMLGWTGSRQFERSLRLYSTRERGWKLTSTGVFSARTGQRIDLSSIIGRSVECEEDIFEALGVPYLPPEERNC